MRRLPLLLVPLLLAACGGGATGPDEDEEPIFLVPPRFYDGTAHFKRTTSAGGDLVQFDGNVRFATTDRGALPVGYAIVSGTMTVSHQGGRPGGCTIAGATSFTLGPGDGAFVIMAPDRYSGTIHKEVTFSSNLTCPGRPAVPSPDSASIDLDIAGSTINGRIQGAMVPVVAAQSVFEGSWNLTPLD
jgi:hypothetical protein